MLRRWGLSEPEDVFDLPVDEFQAYRNDIKSKCEEVRLLTHNMQRLLSQHCQGSVINSEIIHRANLRTPYPMVPQPRPQSHLMVPPPSHPNLASFDALAQALYIGHALRHDDRLHHHRPFGDPISSEYAPVADISFTPTPRPQPQTDIPPQ